MGKMLLAMALVQTLVVFAEPAHAQSHDSGGLPAAVTAEITRLFNDPATVRRNGATDLPRDSTIAGALAVRSGPVSVAGHVGGTLLVINADVRFAQGARIDGGVIVVGGRIDGQELATIGGGVRVYAETIRYRMSGDDLTVEEERSLPLITTDDDGFWQRGHKGDQTRFDLLPINGANTYNRVEGLPIIFGPRLRMERDWGSLLLQARGIVRTAGPFTWNRASLGHDMRTEVRWGTGAGFGIGGTAFDRVDPVESWQLGDNEAGLAAVLIHRDYRDYYARHGGNGFVKAYLDANAVFTLSYGEERWESREARHPWSLFRNDESWPTNPAVDDGFAHLITAAFDADTRHNRYSSATGWYAHGDLERGLFNPAPSTLLAGDATNDARRNYTRGFLDVRRYTRVAPHAEVNVRAVLGGWLGGDELPLERRFSVSGPGTLPGFDFREATPGLEDRLQCSESGSLGSGLPALCDRVALVQLEYRGDLSWRMGAGQDRRWWPSEFRTPTWSVFFDAGRGWRAKDDGITTYQIQGFPALSTFQSDLGIGLDFGPLSVSLAKSISSHNLPMNVVVRLSPRF